MDELSLIDVSAEDDFLLDLASPPQHPDPPPRAAPGTSVVGADLEHPAGGSHASAAAGQVLDPSAGATEQVVPERTESPKKRKPKGGVNLRKSLAWDSAFFTGEGRGSRRTTRRRTPATSRSPWWSCSVQLCWHICIYVGFYKVLSLVAAAKKSLVSDNMVTLEAWTDTTPMLTQYDSEETMSTWTFMVCS